MHVITDASNYSVFWGCNEKITTPVSARQPTSGTETQKIRSFALKGTCAYARASTC